jgi:hypothetical protein
MLLGETFEIERLQLLGIESGTRKKEDARNFVTIRRQDARKLIRIFMPNQTSNQAALDVCSQFHGTNNFKILKQKLSALAIILPVLNETINELLEQMSRVERILGTKSHFSSDNHFNSIRNSNGPAIHCHHFAFGIKDPAAVAIEGSSIPQSLCGHYH